MGRITRIVAVVALSGCAAHRGVKPAVSQERIISTSWATVLAIPAGTEVGVLLARDEIRYGRVNEVTPEALTLWERKGIDVLPRTAVQRLAIRTPVGASRTPRVVAGAIAGTIIAGAAAWFGSAMEENPGPGGGRFLVVFLGTALGAAAGAGRAPVETFREQIIYIRP